MDYEWALRYEMNEITKREGVFTEYRAGLSPDDPMEQELEAEVARTEREWQFYNRDRAGNLKDLRHWSGGSLHQMAKAVGWLSHYRTIYKLTSTRAHSTVKASNDYLSLVNGRLRVRTGRSDNLVGNVLFSANGYGLEVGRVWCTRMDSAHDLCEERERINATIVEAFERRRGARPERAVSPTS